LAFRTAATHLGILAIKSIQICGGILFHSLHTFPQLMHANRVSLIDGKLSLEVLPIDRICEKSRTDIQKSYGGRPTKLNATDKCRLLCTITSGKADNAVQLTCELRNVSNIEVSAQTVCCALKEAGLKAATKKKKP